MLDSDGKNVAQMQVRSIGIACQQHHYISQSCAKGLVLRLVKMAKTKCVFFNSQLITQNLFIEHSDHCESELLLLRYMITTQPEEYLNIFFLNCSCFNWLSQNPF